MADNSPLDLEALHCILWNRSDPLGAIRVSQHDFCHELGVNRYTLNRALQQLVDGGALHRITRSGVGAQKYVVTDPHVVDPAAYA